MILQNWNTTIIGMMFKIHFPISWIKSASPILETSYHDFTNLSIRHKGENIQLNIDLHQGAASGSLFCVTHSGDAIYKHI